MASRRVMTPNTMVMLNEDYQGDNSGSLSRPTSRQSAGSRIGSGLPRRTPTPTKQVFLTTVRRKDSGEYDSTGERSDSPLSQSTVRHNGFYGDVQAMTSKFNQPTVPRERRKVCSRGDNSNGIHSEINLPSKNRNNSGLPTPYPQLDQENISTDSLNHSTTDTLKTDSDDDDDNDDEGDAGEGEEEQKKAPSELLMEFVGCLMEKDYKNAEKLCKMILLYEPEHPEALKFQPLIQEKLQQEEDEKNTGADSGDDDEDDDDDESDSEDSDSEDSSSEEEGKEDTENETSH